MCAPFRFALTGHLGPGLTWYVRWFEGVRRGLAKQISWLAGKVAGPNSEKAKTKRMH